MLYTGDSQFVELNRTFKELTSHTKNDDEDALLPNPLGKVLTWAELEQEFRIILLSEAGTGKTAEMRHWAGKLRSDGKQAFFLRLENVPSDFEVAFEVGTYEQFTSWLASSEHGWLLLDSVDEARLRSPRDFELAIRKLGKRVAAALERVHLVISSRTRAWRPKTDLEICTRFLPFGTPDQAISGSSGEFMESATEINLQTEHLAPASGRNLFKILALVDLNAEQVKILAGANGVRNTKGFLEAIEKADAWAFATRPQDLIELSEFWNGYGRIGTRSEIMASSIDRRLSEKDPDRDEVHPLSAKRAREGARLIAAATTLGQFQTISVPDAVATNGIAVAAVLHDWGENECSTLLSRPIFDEAVYGTQRFHHRSVREFLVAEWLAELLKREASRRKVESLLFRNQYGIEVVVRSMRPVLPWLAIFDEKICERVFRVAPEVLLQGGDPAKLPVAFRRRLLRHVCEQIAGGTSNRNLADYSAVQRFATHDIAEDVVALLKKYATNDDVVNFLLRMVWVGELREGISVAKQSAVSIRASKYTRIAAIRAVHAVGLSQDVAEVRLQFLASAPELNRELLAELLSNAEPTPHNATWLLDCIAKVKAVNRNRGDQLASSVSEFVQKLAVEFIPDIVPRLNKFLDTEPVLERRHCEVSQEFSWLLTAAAYAVKQLIEAHHPAGLSQHALDILDKYSTCSDEDHRHETKIDFSTIVTGWRELCRSCFWNAVSKSLQSLEEKREGRLTEWWQIHRSFWQFDIDDFEYFVDQVAIRGSKDERTLALSMAFSLYIKRGRKRSDRIVLKRAAAGDASLADQLAKYLKPPARGVQSWRRMETTLRRRRQAHLEKQERNKEEWRAFLRANVDTVRSGSKKRGEMLQSQWYLHERMRDLSKDNSHWGTADWRTLRAEFGDDVARAFRDGVAGFWRKLSPKIRSEGAPSNETPYVVVFGLTGLEIEATETPNWSETLSEQEVATACRYASHELNGFPVWFPSLFVKHPAAVGNFLLGEIRYELAVERAEEEGYYVMADVGSSGQWAWDELAPSIYALLEAQEPKNVSNLSHLLHVLQGSSMLDVVIAKLASQKCRTLTDLDHVARWFAVWVGVEPNSALPELVKRFRRIATQNDRTLFAMKFIRYLLGDHSHAVSDVRNSFCTPDHLKQLYLLMHKHIRVKDDTRRGEGVYSPGARDEAQDARNRLADLIRAIPGKEAFIALWEISQVHPEESFRPWFAQLAHAKAEADAETSVWLPKQVREFHDAVERTPKDHRELAELVELRLLDLKDDLENGDASVANLLKGAKGETMLRNFIAREFRQKAQGRYSISQEDELADAKRPDLRIFGAGFDGPVPCELKLADKWTGPQLLERMENQLSGDYLRDNHSTHGFFVLVYQGTRKSWKLPGVKKAVDFDVLVAELEQHWKKIALSYPNVDRLEVVGIDLTKRSK